MPDYPLLFTVRDAISGNGYLAGVTVSGRAIMRQEEDGKWWMTGVRPGGIAASGGTLEEAFLRFRETYRNVLFDLAEESEEYDDFRHEVDTFYSQTDEVEEKCWVKALKEMRAGGIPTEGFISTLPKLDPETRPTHCGIIRLDDKQARYTATDNVPDFYALPAAA